MDQEALLAGETLSRRLKTSFPTIPFILGNQALEKMAYYGVYPTMIIYLTAEYGMGTAEAVNILFLWSAATNLFPLIAAFLADSFTGRFPLIAYGSIISFLGFLSLWLTTIIPHECNNSTHVCQPTTRLQLLLLYSFFTLTAIGGGGIRSSCLAFATDQLEPNGDTSALETLFNWYYFSVMLAAFLSQSLLVYIQTIYGWKIGFGVSLALMALSLALFFITTPFYIRLKCESGLVTGFFQVLVAAFRNRFIDFPSEEEQMIVYHSEKGSLVSSPSEKLRYLNKACMTSNRNQDLTLTLTEETRNPWKLCTVQQVEILKSLITVLPIWSTGIMLSLVTACQISFIVLQAKSMDRSTFIPGFEIPPASYGVFMIISFISALVLYDLLLIPFVSWALRKPFRFGAVARMGAGLVLSVLCISSLAAVEYLRRKTVREEEGVMMSAMWLLPYMILGGIAEAVNYIAQNEFFYSELPKSMASVAFTLCGLGMAAANLLSSWIVSAVDVATSGRWITEDINNGRLDYYYWLLAGLCVVNVFYFVLCSKAYGQCKKEGTEE